MRLRYADPLPEGHEDLEHLRRLEHALFKRLKRGKATLAKHLPGLLRQAIDEVIDTPRTGRTHAIQLEKTEKTYIGTKVEIIIRNFFRLPKGVLDLHVDGMEIDVKNTLGDTWMIPREAVGQLCILVASDERRRTCYFGLLRAKLEYLSGSTNQDKKRSITSAGRANIHWVLLDHPYPRSFWSELGADKTKTIMAGFSGNDRVAALFREAIGVAVNREIIKETAQQKDYMRRLRRNGGARDHLRDEGIAVLSGQYDAPLIQELELAPIAKDEFVSVRPTAQHQIDLLRAKGKIA